ncbi:DegT/DnrJ/EryC1/StrS family aminotransferase [Halorubrum tebenquichense]|uniref:DegT/DnrJ/EryC1/StrS aminotransferase n=1 Tax=Halorubrum tebenquichense DSM 14210 TaxID=1227485 RepID=M0DXH0_9EURY|nr:DegT/DnrJ/EryC1/StrS family aminotransferase [Halorubrum tebenquichense]ELZ39417.1 DegT/DnrJ/EryC1/StrS aminotransferase [Halorubrum tebenquichense DSM 14210]
MDVDEILTEIEPKVEQHFEEEETFIPGESKIRLSRPTYGTAEVMESLESLLSTWVTMGDKVQQFESGWSEYTGSDHGVMVNSGSSANLLALKALEGTAIEPGDEVIVPAVSWSTSVFPILDVGATPVLVDVDSSTYTIDIDAAEEAITEDTAAILPVHLLGNPCDMDALVELCERHDLALIEDCCEAHGARYDGDHVGSFGDMGTFSFFFSHHISTIEGGMIVTDSDDYLEKLRMSRAHGWVREVDDNSEFVESNPEIDERFLFASTGYNLRPTEIQGGFGIHQLDRIDGFLEKRKSNAEYLNEKLLKYSEIFSLLEEHPKGECSWFAYPLLLREDAPISRDELQSHLKEHNIETRPILAGNMARQPVFDSIPHRVEGDLEHSEHIHENGLFVGNHHRMTEEKLEYIWETIDKLIEENI